jgi:hypothetical protein
MLATSDEYLTKSRPRTHEVKMEHDNGKKSLTDVRATSLVEGQTEDGENLALRGFGRSEDGGTESAHVLQTHRGLLFSVLGLVRNRNETRVILHEAQRTSTELRLALQQAQQKNAKLQIEMQRIGRNAKADAAMLGEIADYIRQDSKQREERKRVQLRLYSAIDEYFSIASPEVNEVGQKEGGTDFGAAVAAHLNRVECELEGHIARFNQVSKILDG